MGHDGQQGPTGPIGNTGATGYTGPTGHTGPTGPMGHDGQQGPTGHRDDRANGSHRGWRDGVRWAYRADGIYGPHWRHGRPTGPMGPTGDRGATGPAGDRGATGKRGLWGQPVITGATGATGPAGDHGATGQTGPMGPTGDHGATGATGPAGGHGATGPMGPMGDHGATGANGPTGPTGPAGASGAGEMESGYNPDARLSGTSESVVSVSIPVSAGSKLMAIATGVVTTNKVGALTAAVDVTCEMYLGASGSNAIGVGEVGSNVNNASLAVTGSWSSLPAGTEMVSLNCSASGSIDLEHVTLNVWGGA